jgi:hypothetical protein
MSGMAWKDRVGWNDEEGEVLWNNDAASQHDRFE